MATLPLLAANSSQVTRARRAGLLAGLLFLAVAMSATVAIEAQDAPKLLDADLYSTGLASCGGRGEPACPLFGLFMASNGGICDRGLTWEPGSGTCINSTRRQDVGNKFATTWAGRAMRIQRQDLNWTTPINRMSWPQAHNAFSNWADGYAFPNQTYSMTELLDAGIRVINWDLHSGNPDPAGKPSAAGQVPELCHAEGNHSTCLQTDRDAFNIAKELRDWMLEPGHESEVVLINIENHTDANRFMFDNAVSAYLDQPGIGVFKADDDLTLFLSQLDGPHETSGGTEPIDFERPSQQWLVDTGQRVVLDLGDLGWSTKIIDEWRADGHRFPTCTITQADHGTTDMQPLSGRMRDVYSDEWLEGADTIFPGEIAELTKCNVDTISWDRMLDSDYRGEDRLAATVWSWERDEPPIDATGRAARLSTATTKWKAEPNGEARRHLCRKDGVDRPETNVPVVRWLLSDAAGPFATGHEACAATDPATRFLPPRNGYENLKAVEAMQTAGVDEAWVNFASAGGDRWFIYQPPSLEGIDVFLTPIYTDITAFFGVDGEFNSSFVNVTWDFGDNTAGITGTFVTHSYAAPGTKTVTVTLTDPIFGGTAQHTRDVNVLDGNNTLLGAQISIGAPPSALEGDTVIVYLSRSILWRLEEASCGAGGVRTALGPSPIPFINLGNQYEMHCFYPGGATRTENISVTASTDEVVSVFPVFETRKKFETQTRPIPIGNRPPALTTPTSPVVVPFVDSKGDLTLPIVLNDAPNEPLTLTVTWGDGSAPVTFPNLSPGPLSIQKRFTAATRVGVPLTAIVTLSDESASDTKTIPINVLAPPPFITLNGPTDARVGEIKEYFIVTLDRLSLVSWTCGPSGEVTAGPTSLGVLGYRVSCRFGAANAANRLVVTLRRDEDDVTNSASLSVRIGTPPEILLDGPRTVTEGDVVGFVVQGYPTEGDDVTVGAIRCGTANPVAQSGDNLGGGNRNLEVTFDCAFTTGPGTVPVSATVHDSDGDTVKTIAVTVNNVAPSITALSGPPGRVQRNEPVSIRIDALDPGPALTATISWDDATAPDVMPMLKTGTSHSVTASHTWVKAGIRTITVEVRDGHSTPVPRTLIVQVGDIVPPVVTVPAPITVEATSPNGAVVTFTASANDNIEGAIVPACVPASGATFALGSTTVTCTAADSDENMGSATSTVMVVDTTAPTIARVTPTPGVLWPANGKMVPVSIAVAVHDAVDPAPACEIASVTSSEPVSSPAWQMTGALTLNLVAERRGQGNGRTYTIGIVCTDRSGQAATAPAIVLVPHDQGKK